VRYETTVPPTGCEVLVGQSGVGEELVEVALMGDRVKGVVVVEVVLKIESVACPVAERPSRYPQQPGEDESTRAPALPVGW
jgi:hypothetical protein